MYYLTNKYCCTCLSTEPAKLIDLTSLDYDSVSFYDKLTTCVPNRVSTEMKIQENFLCEDCARNVSQFYDFYNLCMKSKTVLDNIGLKVQYFKVGEEDTVVNIVPNEYYTFDEPVSESNQKSHKTTTELVSNVLKNGVVPESSYMCNICKEKFPKKGLLIVHITVEHSRQKYCYVCDKEFTEEVEYKTHMESHSEVDSKPQRKKHACNVCKRNFANNSALFRHKKIHTNDRRYACDLCSVRYIQKAQIVNHIAKYHPGHVYEEKKCRTCRKIFETKTDLEIHSKINHELKFDLGMLEKLQATSGSIKNIIECRTNIGCDLNDELIGDIENIDLDIIENANIIEEVELTDDAEIMTIK